MQPLWKTVWRFLFKKLKIELPYDPAIPEYTSGKDEDSNFILFFFCNNIFILLYFLTLQYCIG